MKNIIKTQFQGKLTSSNIGRNDDSKMSGILKINSV